MTEKQAIYYELLVLRCQRGQRDALEELVRNWEKRLFYYVRRLVGDEQTAWQVLQETWVKVLVGVWYGIAGILGLMGAPLLSRIVSILIAIISLGFVGLAAWTIKGGTTRLNIQPPVVAGMIWAFVVVMLAGLMSKGIRSEPIWAIQVVVYGTVFLMVASLLMVLTCIRQSELNTREKLLEIEYRIAELAEKLEGKSEK